MVIKRSSTSQYLPEGIKLDAIQISVLGIMDRYALDLEQKSIFSLFKKSTNKKGIYLHGGVGRGKTMIMKAFYERLNVRKQLVHYQNFMHKTHQELHKLQLDYGNNIIPKLAKQYASAASVILIDEFEIKDITDAMMVGRLFSELLKQGVFVLITSNTVPENLYKDGLQRESLLPFIDLIKKEFEILLLDNNHDYRLDKLASLEKRIFYPLNQEIKRQFETVIKDVTGNTLLEPSFAQVFGRKIEFAKTHKAILITSFAELCMRELGSVDYVNICQRFNIIVLEDVPIIPSDNSDVAIRFINFIDNAYFYKVILFASLEEVPEKIYTDGKRSEEFKRTISRLHEMNSSTYMEVSYDEL
jgi:cell division protein ZapE